MMSCVHEFQHVRNIHAREMARLPASRIKYFDLQSEVSVSQPSYFFSLGICRQSSSGLGLFVKEVVCADAAIRHQGEMFI